MRLLLDEMWSPEISLQLRQRGHDVESVVERDALRGRPDFAVFAVALSERRALVTEDVSDYRALARTELEHGRTHFGLIFTSDRRFSRHDSRTLGRMVSALDALLTSTPDVIDLEFWL